MREIKFRAWDIENRILEYIDDLYWFEENGIKDFSGKAIHTEYIYTQYTGFKDINSREIYEGDIVLTSLGQKIVVKYYKLYAGYIPFVSDGGCGCCSDDFTRYNPEHVKVIGNIFENPELLKDDDN